MTVAEQSPARAVDGGGGLGVDVHLLHEVTGIDADPPVLHGIDRDGTAWHLLQGWLEEHAVQRAGVTLHRGTDVISATAGDGRFQATVVTDAGTDDADLVIGADGARSTVRCKIDPGAHRCATMRECCCGAHWSTRASCRLESPCLPTASRPGRCTRGPTGW